MTYRAQVVIPFFTNLPTDVITNTFHFRDIVPSTTNAVATAVSPLLGDLYELIYASSRGASYVNWPGSVINWYDLDDPPPRVPLTTVLGASVTPTGGVIPTEVAMVSSFQGDPVSGIPAGRRRGRVYLGGFAGGAAVGSASAFPTWSPTTTGDVAAAFDAFQAATAALANHRWVVHSVAAGQDFDVTNGWVDNGPDTQRRRSVDATLRTTWFS